MVVKARAVSREVLPWGRIREAGATLL